MEPAKITEGGHGTDGTGASETSPFGNRIELVEASS